MVIVNWDLMKILASITLALVAIVLFAAGNTSAYQECGYTKTNKMPMKVYVDPGTYFPLPPGVSHDQLVTAVKNAWQAWADLPDSAISFELVNTLVGASHIVQSSNTYIYPGYSTCPGYLPQKTTVNNTFNGTAQWDVDASDGVEAGQYSLEGFIRHSIGHVLGLADSCFPEASGVMCADMIKPGVAPVNVDADAQRGMAALYPQPPVSAPVRHPN